MMDTPTYSLQPEGPLPEPYLPTVRRLADDVMALGRGVAPLVTAYGDFVERAGREARRSHAEYLLEALTLGVLWRARGREAADPNPRRHALVQLLVRERRSGAPRRRDGSTAALVSEASQDLAWPNPSLEDLARLLGWLLASGEYDDELARLEGWGAFLAAAPDRAGQRLASLVAFAMAFEEQSLAVLGPFTADVDRFLGAELRVRGAREDTMQCSRRRIEYHLNMVGAEILNRAWRSAFLACRRHVVVMSGCMRRQPDARCGARRAATALQCTHCTRGCAVSTTARAAEAAGAEAYAVVHGSDFSRFLSAAAGSSNGDVGIVGIACVPGLMGAGWRARAMGLPAQCVLLKASGCAHWRNAPTPTSIDPVELARILASADVAAAPPRSSRRNGAGAIVTSRRQVPSTAPMPF